MVQFKFLIILLSVFIELKGWKNDNNDTPNGDRFYKINEEPQNVTESEQIKPEWFIQKLDHFDRYNTKIWEQRYYTNETFFKIGGPVFLYIGGEGPLSGNKTIKGNWITYAKQFNALLFALEHRFYGESVPTSDLSTDNLRKYLSSELALEDLAVFIQVMNKKYKLPVDTKWIVFGGSYPGTLAAWLRMRHPKLVHGAVSSSAPVLAQLDFQDYFKVVYESLRSHSLHCVQSIKSAFDKIADLLGHQMFSEVSRKFNCCIPLSSFDDQENLSLFYNTIADEIAGAVQYSESKKNKELSGSKSIEGVCNIMTNQSLGPPLDRLSKLMGSFFNKTCVKFNYKTYVTQLRNVSWSEDRSHRQWMFQTCNEFGFYQTSKKSIMFPDQFQLDFFVKLCQDIFGSEYDRDYVETAVNRTNAIYHGLDLNVSRVVFVHGSVDPWHASGITLQRSPEVPVIFIKGTSHCQDMANATEDDLPELINARIQIGKIIEHWLDM